MSGLGQTLTPELRARLARKGQLLYAKSCGRSARGSCALSFALYHIWNGESDVARDLLAFLDSEIAKLRVQDSDGRLTLTIDLAARIRRHLDHESEPPPNPALRAAILKANKEGP